MSWVRIDDRAMSHPKLNRLSDKAFRLWVWGLAYAQQHLTDGWIPSDAPIPARLTRAVEELTGPGLWEPISGGVWIHDYLDWNDSRDKVMKSRTAAKERMRHVRSERSPENTTLERSETPAREVPSGWVSSTSFPEKEREKKPPDSVAARAGNLLRRYRELYQQHRHGAQLRLTANSLEFSDACSICDTWADDARIEKLAVLVLTTDDAFIAGTDRSFRIFALKASWADDKLKAWEVANGVSV